MQEELKLGEESRNNDNIGQVTGSNPPETEKSVLTKLNERKASKNNIMIHGVQEIFTEDDKDRKHYDDTKVNNILQTCKIQATEENKVTKIIRRGRFDMDKPKRPILITFKNIATKRQ